MIRFISALLFGLLLLNSAQLFAQEQSSVSTKSANEETFEGYNFNDTSFYITDEQMQEAKEIDQIEENSSLTSKIINSSHFTSQTATKTYIPINKVTE